MMINNCVGVTKKNNYYCRQQLKSFQKEASGVP